MMLSASQRVVLQLPPQHVIALSNIGDVSSGIRRFAGAAILNNMSTC
jgi:hypothetical protein